MEHQVDEISLFGSSTVARCPAKQELFQLENEVNNERHHATA